MSQTCLTSSLGDAEWQQRFVRALPKIERFAHRAFRKCTAELRDELVAEVVADAYIWYRRLVERGFEHNAHPTVLASYSVKRVGCGVRVGSPRNRRDLMSRYSQLRSGLHVQSLHRRDAESGEWREMLIACSRIPPAELAAWRIDIAHWFSTLSVRNRAIAVCLAVGESTSAVAARFHLTPGRISQLRRELAASWFALHGLDESGCDHNAAAA